MKETVMVKILKLLAKESPLSPTEIREKLGIPDSSVRSTLSMLKSLRFVRYYQGLIQYDPNRRALYELTEEGKKRVEELAET